MGVGSRVGVLVDVGVGVRDGANVGEGVTDGIARWVATTNVAISSGEVLGTVTVLHAGATMISASAAAFKRLDWFRKLASRYRSIHGLQSPSSNRAAVRVAGGRFSVEINSPCEFDGSQSVPRSVPPRAKMYNARMDGFKRTASRWLPAVVVMLTIFTLSAQPPSHLPRFGWAEVVIKKAGHVMGYGLLALSFRRGLGTDRRWLAPAWILSVLYGLTDEVHQAFVPGRHPSPIDVLLFDGAGAALALLLAQRAPREGSSAK
jgi:VanZ family protein